MHVWLPTAAQGRLELSTVRQYNGLAQQARDLAAKLAVVLKTCGR